MEANLYSIQYGSKQICYNLAFAERKTINIKVKPDTQVYITAPLQASVKDIEEKIISKARWILKNQTYFNKYLPHTKSKKFVNGETHLYLGRQYRLRVIKSINENVKLYRGELVINAKEINAVYIEKILSLWYKEKAFLHFEEVFEIAVLQFKKHKIVTPVLQARQMQKRWGSCTAAGKITLNTELIKAPKGCIEYVIIHELCHLVHYNHNKYFYSLLCKQSPSWEKWKEKLEQVLS